GTSRRGASFLASRAASCASPYANSALRAAPAPSPPAAMDPQPLFRVLADPAFGDGRHQLRRGGDGDAAVGVAWADELLGDLDAEAVARQADGTDAIERAVVQPREQGHHRMREAAPPEEGDLDAAHEMLVGQPADQLAAAHRIVEAAHRRRVG